MQDGSSTINTTKKKPYVLKLSLPTLDVSVCSRHKTAGEAARAAWELCVEYDLEMPSADWYVDTRYGPQTCYDIMVTRDDDRWDEKKEFVRYMTNHAAKGTVRLHDDDSFLVISKK